MDASSDLVLERAASAVRASRAHLSSSRDHLNASSAALVSSAQALVDGRRSGRGDATDGRRGR